MSTTPKSPSSLRFAEVADDIAKVSISEDNESASTPTKKTSFSVHVDENQQEQEDYSDEDIDENDENNNESKCNNTDENNSCKNIRISGGAEANKIVRTNSFERKKQQAAQSNITVESIRQSIPDDIWKKISEWKVKYAFITKGAKLVSTSKQHKFKTPVSVDDALSFLVESVVKDSTLVFTNDNSLIFSDGLYNDLDLLDSDEE